MKRAVVTFLMIATLSGCQNLLHNLQPHRLRMLNYQENPGRSDSAFLSISDDLSQAPKVTPINSRPKHQVVGIGYPK